MKNFKDIYKKDLIRTLKFIPQLALWIIAAKFFPSDLEFYLNTYTLIHVVSIVLVGILLSSFIKYNWNMIPWL